MMSRLSQASLLALVALPLLSLGATAQIAVSANDNKVTLVNGVNTVVANPPPDTVTPSSTSAFRRRRCSARSRRGHP
jgi:hypothetical protein